MNFFYKFGIEIIIKYFQTNLIDNKQNTSQPASNVILRIGISCYTNSHKLYT